MWLSMVTYTRNLCCAVNSSKVHTHSIEHTHTVNTHPQQWAAFFLLQRPGSSWGFGALLKGTSVVVLRVERERCTFTPPTYNSCWTWDSNSQPLGYESDSLTIKPQLPHNSPGTRALAAHCSGCVFTVYWFLWFTGTQMCLITWVWQRYYNMKVVYEDTAYVPVIQKA